MGLEDRKTAEAANVRLVRCPKCENLLPELPDFPLYQCGGCGAVLRGTIRTLCVILCAKFTRKAAVYMGNS